MSNIEALEYYNNEKEYISPNKVSQETINRIKARKIGARILSW